MTFVDYTLDFFAKGGGKHIYNNQYPDDEWFISQHLIDLKLYYDFWEIIEKKSDDEMIIRCRSIWDMPERIMLVKRIGKKSFEVEYID